jgi:hypothetical protein
MAKAMTAFHEKKIPREAVDRLLARIHLTADRMFPSPGNLGFPSGQRRIRVRMSGLSWPPA